MTALPDLFTPAPRLTLSKPVVRDRAWLTTQLTAFATAKRTESARRNDALNARRKAEQIRADAYVPLERSMEAEQLEGEAAQMDERANRAKERADAITDTLWEAIQ